MVGQHNILSLLRLLKVKRPLTKQMIRLGNNFDGGYVVCDDMSGITSAISIGIGDNVSFDYEIAELGIKVLQFDHTVQYPPVNHPNFIFTKIAWGEASSESEISLSKILSHFNLIGHELFLKFDVEGAEWNNLPFVTPEILKQCRLIVGEFHSMHMINDINNFIRIMDTFNKLCLNHTLIHIHANNYGNVHNILGITIPEVIELTFLRNDRDSFEEYTGPLPCSLDFPNCPSNPDIILKW